MHTHTHTHTHTHIRTYVCICAYTHLIKSGSWFNHILKQRGELEWQHQLAALVTDLNLDLGNSMYIQVLCNHILLCWAHLHSIYISLCNLVLQHNTIEFVWYYTSSLPTHRTHRKHRTYALNRQICSSLDRKLSRSQNQANLVHAHNHLRQTDPVHDERPDGIPQHSWK